MLLAVPFSSTHGIIEIRDPAKVNFSTATPASQYLTKKHDAIITFRHPAYLRRDSGLFTISALDHDDGGILHALAVCLCSLIADNREGFLSLTPDGAPIVAGPDDVLKAVDYYYIVPHPDGSTIETPPTPYNWPVVTVFADWEFPPILVPCWTRSLSSSLPPMSTGSQSNYTQAVRVRDVTCRVTQHSTGTEVAHLVPELERDWFIENNMSKYKQTLNSDQDHLLKDPANILLLRSDIHKAFDDRLFILFLKGPEGSLVIHMLQQNGDLTHMYHNVKVHPIPYCRREFLFARLAWAVFPSLAATFLSRPTPRRVVKVDYATGERSVVETADPLQLQLRAAEARSRSPKKRQRDRDPMDAELDSGTTQSESESDPSQKRARRTGFNPDGQHNWGSGQKTSACRVQQEGQIEDLRAEALKRQRILNQDIIRRHKESGGTADRKDVYSELMNMGFEITEDDTD